MRLKKLRPGAALGQGTQRGGELTPRADFFEKRGFTAKTRNTVFRAGEWLANTTMTKPLGAEAIVRQ